MRELTKSMISYSLATTILGLQQVTQILSSGGDLSETTGVVNRVTATMVDNMSDGPRSTYLSIDKVQRTAVDILLGGWNFNTDAICGTLCAPSGQQAAPPGRTSMPQEPVGPMGSWDWEDARVPTYGDASA